jgi:CheY-like chemotaxis protein
MPSLDGLMLCRVLRGLRAHIALPIVVFTGVGEADPCLLPLRVISTNFGSCTSPWDFVKLRPR